MYIATSYNMISTYHVDIMEKQTMETTSITTATVGIVVVVAPTEHVSQVVPGQEVPHCV